MSPIAAAGDDADDADDSNGNMTVDFGFVQSVSIGSAVWEDANGNGVQDAGEALLTEGMVTLLDGAGNPATDISGAVVGPVDLATTGGTYFFDNLPEGDYIVQVSDLAAGYEPTVAQTTTDDSGANELDSNIASDDGAGTYQSAPINLTFGDEAVESTVDGIAGDGDDADSSTDNAGDMTVDFGVVRPVSIGSAVWQDANGDGIQDAGEPLIDEGLVTLIDASTGLPATDIDGAPIAPIDL